MRRGILPVMTRPEGGIRQYSFLMLEALRVLNRRAPSDELVVFADDTEQLEPFLKD